MEFVSHPARESPGLRALAYAALIAVTAGFSALFRSVFWGAFAGLLLAAAIARFLFPTRYVLTPTGVTAIFLGRARSRRWTEFRRATRERNGILLSPFRVPSALDEYRGFYIRCPHNRAAVEAYLDAHFYAELDGSMVGTPALDEAGGPAQPRTAAMPPGAGPGQEG